MRRRTDFKDTGENEESEKEKSNKAETPFNLKRSTTGNLGGVSSWGLSGGFTPGGAFGNFAIGSPTATAPDKRPGFGSLRGNTESRFKGLMKETTEDDKSPSQTASLANLGQTERPNPPKDQQLSSKALIEAIGIDDDIPIGSAALQGADDMSPPRSRLNETQTRPFAQELDDSSILARLGQQTPARRDAAPEAMSPTHTNPYQSPENERPDLNSMGMDHPGLSTMQSRNAAMGSEADFTPLSGLGFSRPGFDGGDRSQTSSAGPRGSAFSGLGPLPGLGGSNSAWPTTLPTSATTPSRERPLGGFGGAFGENIFSPQDNHAQSLSQPAFGPSMGSMGRGAASRLGPLLPHSMPEPQQPMPTDAMFDAFTE